MLLYSRSILFVVAVALYSGNIRADIRPICRNLFIVEDTSSIAAKKQQGSRVVDVNIQERRTQFSWSAWENLGHRVSSNVVGFFNHFHRMSWFRLGSTYQLAYELPILVDGAAKLSIEHVPVDKVSGKFVSPFTSRPILNAGLASGRKFFQSSFKAARKGSVFLFIDVNDLGWVNNNFRDKQEDGDRYIEAVAKSLRDSIPESGLIFRLGGDEFGILMEHQTPEQIREISEKIYSSVKDNAHEVFRSETAQRANEIRRLRRELGSDFALVATYVKAVREFKEYVSHSQEGVSIGASYVDGRTISEIQLEAEQRALAMKVELKKALHQSIAKYTGQIMNYSGPPRMSFRYEMPLIPHASDLPPSPEVAQTNWTGFAVKSLFELPLITLKREEVLQHLGPLNIVRYKSETGELAIMVEYYLALDNHQKEFQIEKLETDQISNFIDLKDSRSVKVLKTLYEKSNSGGLIWFDLLNLRMLNYFSQGTQTGDKALARFSKIISENIRKSDLAMKLPGSEFLVFATGVSKIELEKLTERIEKAIETDAELNRIYEEEASLLAERLKDSKDEEETNRILESIEVVKKLQSSTRFKSMSSDLRTKGSGSPSEIYQKLRRFFN